MIVIHRQNNIREELRDIKTNSWSKALFMIPEYLDLVSQLTNLGWSLCPINHEQFTITGGYIESWCLSNGIWIGSRLEGDLSTSKGDVAVGSEKLESVHSSVFIQLLLSRIFIFFELRLPDKQLTIATQRKELPWHTSLRLIRWPKQGFLIYFQIDWQPFKIYNWSTVTGIRLLLVPS